MSTGQGSQFYSISRNENSEDTQETIQNTQDTQNEMVVHEVTRTTEENNVDDVENLSNEQIQSETIEENNDVDNNEETNQETQEEITNETTEKPAKNKKLSFAVKSKRISEENNDTEEKEATQGLSDEAVLDFLKSKGLQFDSVEDISKQHNLPEAVAQFAKFHEETNGRGMEAYYASKRDWDNEKDEVVLREYYKHLNPDASPESIELQLNVISLDDLDENEHSKREIDKRKLEYENALAKAKRTMKGVAEKYKTPKESTNTQPQGPTQEEIDKMYAGYRTRRDQSLDNIDLNLNIENLGDINLGITDKEKKTISEYTQTDKAFFNLWVDPKTQKVDTDKMAVDMAWAIPKVRAKLIQSLLEQSQVKIMDNESKKRRNVQLGKHNVQEPVSKKSPVTVLGDTTKKQNGNEFFQTLIS